VATTPIYGFVTPDLAATADGPAAMAALAARVEREMSTFRSASEHTVEDTSTIVTAVGSDTTVQSITVPTSVIGWIDIQFTAIITSVDIGPSVDGIGLAGHSKIFVDDVLIRTVRFHNRRGTRTMEVSMTASIGRTAAQTSTNIKAKLSLTTGSSAVDCYTPRLYVRQFGAPGSG
jgi:hypothetical protein